MKTLPDPSFFLQLNESFIKAARLESGGERPCLTAIREISSAELASQPNPIVQIAGETTEMPVPVATTLSLGETVYQSHAFDQIGFSTLTEFIGNQDARDLHKFELGVFQRGDGWQWLGLHSSSLPQNDRNENGSARDNPIVFYGL